MFDNSDGFFTGLPSSDSKVKRNTAYSNLVPKEIRDQFELRVVEHKITKMQAKADKMRQKVLEKQRRDQNSNSDSDSESNMESDNSAEQQEPANLIHQVQPQPRLPNPPPITQVR
jgi:hypothetical protein